MTNADKSSSGKKSILGIPVSETILLAAAPFLAYVFTFAYQAGYFDTFDLPRQFISLSLTDVLNIGGKVLTVIVTVLAVISLPLSFLPKKVLRHPSFARRINVLLPLLLVTLPRLLLYDISRAEAALVLLVMLFAVTVMFLPPLVSKRVKGSYLQRMDELDSHAPSDPWEDSGSLVHGLTDVIGYRFLVVIVYLLVSIGLTYSAGRASATTQSIFPVASTSPNSVVLFMTSDKLITAPFDQQSKTIEPAFSVIKIDEEPNFTLRFSEIGPLKMRTAINKSKKSTIRDKKDGPRLRRPHVDSEPTPKAPHGT